MKAWRLIIVRFTLFWPHEHDYPCSQALEKSEGTMLQHDRIVCEISMMDRITGVDVYTLESVMQGHHS